jgi:Leucine-rich repeat (LRR) protein
MYKNLLFILIASITSITNAQYTSIPDANFEAALETLGYDDISGDGQVPTIVISAITNLNLDNAGIADLTGIEDFTALTILECGWNTFTSVDLSNNTLLQEFRANNCNLTSINISNLTILEKLQINENALQTLDISTNVNLKELTVSDNQLTELNITNNVQLEALFAGGNQLTSLNTSNNILLDELEMYNSSTLVSLDLSTNSNLAYIDVEDSSISYLNVQNGNNTALGNGDFYARNTPNLNCILVDDTAYSSTNWTRVDAGSTFSTTYCRYTTIPDANFEAALETLGYDDISGDGQVPTALIETVTNLDVQNLGITDFTGIEDFIALEVFYFSDNDVSSVDVSNLPVLRSVRGVSSNLSSFDVTNNPLLDDVRIEDNNITSIDFSNNPLLEILQINDNQLSALDLSNNPLIWRLRANNNNITTLDLTNNTALTEVQLQVNDLTELNIQNGVNTNISTFASFSNPNLTCIQVDDALYSTTNWTNIDAASTFSDTFCNYTAIPDTNFELALENLGYDDISGDGQVPTALIESVTNLDIRNLSIADLTGIEDFTALNTLDCSNNLLTTLDISANTNMMIVNASMNTITTVHTGANSLLQFLMLQFNNLTDVDFTANSNLALVDLSDNPITTLDVSQNTNLTALFIRNTALSFIDVTQNTALIELKISGSSISNINLSNNIALEELLIKNCPDLAYLNLKNGTNTSITAIEIGNNPNLVCVAVDDVTYSTTNWTNVNGMFSYTTSSCFTNYTQIPDLQFETALDIIGYDDISGDGQVPTDLISGITHLNLSLSGIATMTGIEDFTSLEVLDISSNSIDDLDLSGNTTIQELYCQRAVNNSLNVSNMTALKILHCYEAAFSTINLTNSTALEELQIYHSVLNSLDVSTNTGLKKLYMYEDTVTSINLNGATALEELYVYRTDITDLDLSTNVALRIVECYEGALQTINTNGANALEELYIQRNNLQNIDVSTNTALTDLYCYEQDLATLNTAGATSLKELLAYSTLLENIDLSTNVMLESLNVANTNLSELNVQNGNNSNITIFEARFNADLYCILVDDATYSTTNWTLIDGQVSFNETTCDAVVVAINVCLQGAMINPNTGEEHLMRDDLRVDDGNYGSTSPYGDGAFVAEEVGLDDQGADSMVDWIWIELRDANDPTIVVAGQSAVLQRDGDVVATSIDLITPLTFLGVSHGNYYIAVKHRNHLGIMSASAITLNDQTTTIDFTDANNQITFGNNAQTTLGMPADIVAMWAGNVNNDGVVQYSGISPDTPSILSEVLNDSGNFLNFPTYALTGLSDSDVNMNATTQYSGTDADTPFILQNVLAHPANSLNFSTFQIQEQLPENDFDTQS